MSAADTVSTPAVNDDAQEKKVVAATNVRPRPAIKATAPKDIDETGPALDRARICILHPFTAALVKRLRSARACLIWIHGETPLHFFRRRQHLIIPQP